MRAKVRPAGDAAPTGDDCFRQTLSFALRLGTETRLPLEPYFVHFEDPEYNRRLVSSSARASTGVEVTGGSQTEMRTVTLATDRREYNPDGRLAVRHDWDVEPEGVVAKLRLRSVDANGVLRELEPTTQDLCSRIEPFPPGTLVQLSLADLRHAETKEKVALRPGETLLIELQLDQQGKELAALPLSLGIVAIPVTPVPEAAYALLRRQVRGDEQHVECARFAWGPEPDRVELVCPADLQTEVVRRRAVFHWSDSARPETAVRYAVQKIARNGATHFPETTEADQP